MEGALVAPHPAQPRGPQRAQGSQAVHQAPCVAVAVSVGAVVQLVLELVAAQVVHPAPCVQGLVHDLVWRSCHFLGHAPPTHPTHPPDAHTRSSMLATFHAAGEGGEGGEGGN